jgi:hypothetical protein
MERPPTTWPVSQVGGGDSGRATRRYSPSDEVARSSWRMPSAIASAGMCWDTTPNLPDARGLELFIGVAFPLSATT